MQWDFRFCYQKKKKDGQIYLKAYEVATNKSLSVERLKKGSTINVFEYQELTCYKPEKTITIYEGGSDCKYVARFEVWNEPKNYLFPEKIFEKNYLINGWSR